MRPETGTWRKAGRRPGRRDAEPVLDEGRDRAERAGKGRNAALRASHVMDDLTVPGLRWFVERFPDEDSGPGYMIVKVTPVVATMPYQEASCGMTIPSDSEESFTMRLIADSTDRLPGVLMRQARDLIQMAEAITGREGITP